MSELITILLVDDHALVREGARAFLEAQPNFVVVGSVGSGGEAVLLAADLAPDVVLMDLVMPGMDGIEATRLLKLRSPRSQVIVLTSYHDDEHIFPAIRAGALSYLLKDVLLSELASAVHKAAAGESMMNPHVAARIAQELESLPKTDGAQYAQLSEREQEVLHLIAEGFPNSEIARRLVISEKTVKSHVSNILSKLHLLDRTQAAVFAWREGVISRLPHQRESHPPA
ncbi:response regulator [Dictyobacter kobayashii]|uniref:DNA-binding response regulator n=1 Tax=Dictyobacter kobayashii TaxID=2014872 RepID=A0A402AM53_9CHLR|nr:response regulator transcription factor [Dictyobacter kobayashii]GCE20115.1 DNA-binding response regulator [Dictyobacter kobayashii]